MDNTTSPRIAPLEPPFADDVRALLERWMAAAPAHEPLKLFRILALHPELASRMGVLGGALLGHPTVDPREREIVIQRTTARCGAGYEWGVHATVFADSVGLSDAQLTASVSGTADDPAWSRRDSLLVRLCDELHDGADVSDGLWHELTRHWTDPELLELIVTAGWYRLISQVVNASRVDPEPWAAPFPTGAA